MPAKFCPKCGKPLELNAKFCGDCGEQIIENIAIANAPVNNSKTTATIQKTPDIAPPKALNTNLKPSLEVKEKSTLVTQTPKTTDSIESISHFAKETNYNNLKEDVKGKIFTSNGRLNRLPYLIYSVIIFVALMIAGGLSATGILAIIGVPIMIACIVAEIMINIRRWHDLNKTGWLTLLNLIPYVNFAVGLYLLFAKGTTGPNQYGPDPLDRR